MKIALFGCWLCLISGYSYSQSNEYVKEGNAAYSAGRYQDAVNKFQAALVVMENKKISKASREYLSIEKKIYQSKQILSLSNDAERALKMGSEAGYKNAKELSQQILTHNPSDVKARKRIIQADQQLASIIRHKNDNLLWTSVVNSNQKTSIENYLRNYPDGLHASEAKQTIDAINEEQLWKETLKDPSEASLRNYLNTSTIKTYKPHAEQRLGKINDDKLWLGIENSDDIQVFYKYLNDTENLYKQHQDDASAKIYLLTAKQNAQNNKASEAVEYFEKAAKIQPLDNQAQNEYRKAQAQEHYQRVKSSNTSVEMILFLKKYPESPYYNEISDQYSRLMSSAFSSKTTAEEYKEVLSYAKTKETSDLATVSYTKIKEQEKKRERSERRKERILLGFGAEIEAFEYTFAYAAKVQLKLGNSRDFLNLIVGSQYTHSGRMEINGKLTEGFMYNQISFPAHLQFNIQNSSWFIAMGGIYHFNLNSQYHSSDKNNLINDNSILIRNNISGEGRIGYNFSNRGNVSMYFKRHITSPFNESYIKTTQYDKGNLHNQTQELDHVGITLMLYLPL